MIAKSLLLYISISCVFYSGKCSGIDDIGINSFAASRSLLAAKEPAKEAAAAPTSKNVTGTLYKVDNCTMVYTRGLSLKLVSDHSEYFSFASHVPKVTGSCANSSSGAGESTLDVAYTGLSGNITDFSMKMVFNASASGSWKLAHLTVSLTCSSSATHCKTLKDKRFEGGFIASQRGFSYHCFQPERIRAEGPKNESTVYLSFNKLQVQPFNIHNGRFSYADDCVGFFSAGIWSGLFVTIILTIIFAYGIIMINNINVTDRFDDPKGAGIQVNVQE